MRRPYLRKPSKSPGRLFHLSLGEMVDTISISRLAAGEPTSHAACIR
jgi:hypothetical protein